MSATDTISAIVREIFTLNREITALRASAKPDDSEEVFVNREVQIAQLERQLGKMAEKKERWIARDLRPGNGHSISAS